MKADEINPRIGKKILSLLPFPDLEPADLSYVSITMAHDKRLCRLRCTRFKARWPFEENARSAKRGGCHKSIGATVSVALQASANSALWRRRTRPRTRTRHPSRKVRLSRHFTSALSSYCSASSWSSQVWCQKTVPSVGQTGQNCSASARRLSSSASLWSWSIESSRNVKKRSSRNT